MDNVTLLLHYTLPPESFLSLLKLVTCLSNLQSKVISISDPQSMSVAMYQADIIIVYLYVL